MTVTGRGMGTRDVSVGVSGGGTGAEASVWVSETSTACMVGAGIKGSLSIGVTVGVAPGTVSEGLSYSEPPVSGLGRGEGEVRGGGSATVVGRFMGRWAGSVAGRVGRSGAEASMWTSDSTVTCAVARGTDGSLSVMVTTGELVGSMTEALSYGAGTVSLTETTNVGGRSGALVTVQGTRLGGYDGSTAARGGGSAAEASTWFSDSQLVGGHLIRRQRAVVGDRRFERGYGGRRTIGSDRRWSGAVGHEPIGTRGRDRV